MPVHPHTPLPSTAKLDQLTQKVAELQKKVGEQDVDMIATGQYHHMTEQQLTEQKVQQLLGEVAEHGWWWRNWIARSEAPVKKCW